MGFGGGGGSQSSTVSQKADPWSGIQPQLLDAAKDTQNLYKQGLLNPQYYPGQTIAPQSQETQQALQSQIQRAQNGSPLTAQAQDYTKGLLGGDYLNNNPHLDATYNRAADQVQSRVNSAFEAGGRHGGGANQRVLGQSLGDLATNIYGGAYDNERNRMQQGLLFAPTLANQDYYDIGQLSSAGGVKDQRAQDMINQDISRFDFNQQAPAQNISDYIGLLNGVGGKYGSSTTTQPMYSNGGANTLGLLGSLGAGGALSGLFGAGTAAATGLPWLSGAGLGSQIGGLAMLASSDSRLKHDITLLDNVAGINIYNFRYNNTPDMVHMGVMAQEILHTHPDAVHVMDDGFLAVDYAKLPLPFRMVH
jgi:hypothetical protein